MDGGHSLTGVGTQDGAFQFWLGCHGWELSELSSSVIVVCEWISQKKWREKKTLMNNTFVCYYAWRNSLRQLNRFEPYMKVTLRASLWSYCFSKDAHSLNMPRARASVMYQVVIPYLTLSTPRTHLSAVSSGISIARSTNYAALPKTQ